MSDTDELPREQAVALRRAKRLEWLSLGFTAASIAVVAPILGSSQAMKTAWIEDIVSTVPQIAFLITLVLVRRPRSAKYPYGHHRAAGIGHLVAGAALVVVALFLLYESLSGLLAAEHPTIGTVQVLGEAVWLGWFMIGVMALIVLPPVLLARAKQKLVPVLNDKVLFADASMHRADWMTNLATAVGVAGIGIGLWWMDYAAALLISLDILRDGAINMRSALLDLMDRRATTPDLKRPHPLVDDLREALLELDWVEDANVRIRNLGRVFHAEGYVVPRAGSVDVEALDEATTMCRDLDWTLRDVSIVPVSELPAYLEEDDEA